MRYDFEQTEEVEEEVAAPKARPPEWWTEENTAKWIEETWGSQAEWSEAQKTWGHKLDGATRAGPACYKPLSNKELVEMRANDPRPANRYYYDGRPIRAYKPLNVGRKKKAA